MYELWKNDLLDFNTLLLMNYKEIGLNEQEYVFLILLARLLKVNPHGWTFSEISTHMTIDDAMCSALFINLLERQYIIVNSKTDESGKRYEEYSIAPLFDKVDQYLKQKQNEANSSDREEIFKLVEHELGILSPMDIETIHLWLTEDGFNKDLIQLALQEMNSYQIKSLRYVDKILLDWKKKNIKTVEEAKRQLIAFRQRKQTGTLNTSQTPPVDPNFYYDWMNE